MAEDRRDNSVSSIRILAPAKVNLGLAILGKRADGYHEIDTIMAMIDLVDEINLTITPERGISISGMDSVPVESNLMTRAARSWSEVAGIEPRWHIDIIKRIPSPAGIGGGSSDVAAVLKALNAIYQHPVSMVELHEIAAHIGADCPFFLNGPAARATGIGTDLRPICAPTAWLVLAITRVTTRAKTATLYGSLTPSDYGTSQHIDRIESSGVRATNLPNSFLRPALAEFSAVRELQQTMTDVTGQAVLSGAGPALYALASSEAEATDWVVELRKLIQSDVEIVTASFLNSSPEPELST